MAVELSRDTQEPDRLEEGSSTMARPIASRNLNPEPGFDNFGADLLVYGTDEILKGTDTATLVAFAALAYQQIKGKGAAHQDFGCVLLLISVLACAAVHVSIGNAYVGRARMILRQVEATRRQQLVRMASYGFAWFAALIQFLSLMSGLVLILLEKPPAALMRYLKPFLQT
jgi:hypothetical protein